MCVARSGSFVCGQLWMSGRRARLVLVLFFVPFSLPPSKPHHHAVKTPPPSPSLPAVLQNLSPSAQVTGALLDEYGNSQVDLDDVDEDELIGVSVSNTSYIPRSLLKKIGYKIVKDEESGEWEAVEREGADQVGGWVVGMWLVGGWHVVGWWVGGVWLAVHMCTYKGGMGAALPVVACTINALLVCSFP